MQGLWKNHKIVKETLNLIQSHSKFQYVITLILLDYKNELRIVILEGILFTNFVNNIDFMYIILYNIF